MYEWEILLKNGKKHTTRAWHIVEAIDNMGLMFDISYIVSVKKI